MNSSNLKLLYSLAALILLTTSASAIPFPYEIKKLTDNILNFELVITGSEITEDNDDSTVTVTINSTKWTVTDLILNPDDGTFNDKLTVSGKIYHNAFLKPEKHIHRGNGGEWEFSLFINADDQIGGFVTDTDSLPQDHGDHVDDYIAVLSAESDGAEISGWRFTLTGEHRGSIVPDSGPGLFTGAIFGFLIVVSRRLRIR